MCDLSRTKALEVVAANLEEMLAIAKEYDVELLLETHDDWLTYKYVEEILGTTQSPHLNILWDVHHPYRLEGEQPEKTWKALGNRVKYTHWKDSYLTDQTRQGYQLCLTGEGDVPLKQIFDLLQKAGFDGYYTFEWGKVWWSDIEEPEIAFKGYTEYMKQLASE